MTPGQTTPASRPTVILVIDDSEVDREIFRRFLSSDPRRDYVVHEHPSISGAVEVCQRVKPDCILLDYSLGDGTGVDFLKLLAPMGETRTFPVVMLTGSGNEKIAADAFKAGAQDYLVKDTVTPDSLQRAVSGALFQADTQRLLDEQRAELERLFQEAQEANARKDQFLAALSHELRTPLTPILTAVSSVEPRNTSVAELEELFATIRRNVELEARLIDDLLDLTRISKGKLRLELRPVDTHQALKHALETCEGEVAAKQLKLQLRLDAPAHTVQADPARLLQVFWNLLKNAVKFTPPGGEIEISTHNPSPGQLQVEVRDTGCGIPAESLTKIFDAFDQGGAKTTRRFGGLGLGLAISRALMEAHGGQVRAESAGPGKGSTFIVTLPATALEVPEVESRTNGTPGKERPDKSPPVGEAVVLLVEDHADSARLLSRCMERRGYRVILAGTMAEAAAAFEREMINAVVSDIGLPDGNGLELIERLLQIRQVPAIALSGYGMEHDLARSRAAGFVEHLTKPVDWQQLDAALARLLKDEPCSGRELK